MAWLMRLPRFKKHLKPDKTKGVTDGISVGYQW